MDENKNFVTRYNDMNLMVNRKLHRKKASIYAEVGKLVHSCAQRNEDNVSEVKKNV